MLSELEWAAKKLFISDNVICNRPVSLKFLWFQNSGSVLFSKSYTPVIVGRFVSVVEHFQSTLHDCFGLSTSGSSIQCFKLTFDKWIDQKSTESCSNQICLV